jgi:hypothetical protein
MAYDTIHSQTVKAIQQELGDKNNLNTAAKINIDNCCYCLLIPVVAIASALTFDNNHRLINTLSRERCVRTIYYAQELVDKKNK